MSKILLEVSQGEADQPPTWEDELEDFFETLGQNWVDCAEDRGAWDSLEENFAQAFGRI